MRSKQYFTSIKNNPHEISTDPIYQITQSSKEVKKNKKRYTFYFQYISFSEEPKAGLEPATYSLRMSYSTN